MATAEHIKAVARRVKKAREEEGRDLVVVVSAMGKTTDRLLGLADEVARDPSPREIDQLLSTGEQQSVALLAMALHDRGVAATSLSGSQAGMKATGSYGSGVISEIQPERMHNLLAEGQVVIVAGFQGTNALGDVMTLGRGGSDTTAVALAAALGAYQCEIYTDVDGIYTADPRVVPSAQKIESISSEEMLELAASGAKILHLRCVEYARRFGVPLHVRSSFSQHEGTWVIPSAEDKITTQEGVALEQPIISGVAHDRSEAKVTVVGVPDIPGKAAAIFQVIADAHSNIDMIVQNVSTHGTGRTDISFTLPIVEGADALAALRAAQAEIGFESIEYNEQIGKLSLIGAGMRSHPGVSATFFKALSAAGININMISTSEIRISVVTHADLLDEAVRVIHKAFGLDSESEATVYGGTGR